jgi:hypothetical protein
MALIGEGIGYLAKAPTVRSTRPHSPWWSSYDQIEEGSRNKSNEDSK